MADAIVTSLTIPVLGKGTAYYYRVKATKTGATTSAWKTAANGCRVN